MSNHLKTIVALASFFVILLSSIQGAQSSKPGEASSSKHPSSGAQSSNPGETSPSKRRSPGAQSSKTGEASSSKHPLSVAQSSKAGEASSSKHPSSGAQSSKPGETSPSKRRSPGAQSPKTGEASSSKHPSSGDEEDTDTTNVLPPELLGTVFSMLPFLSVRHLAAKVGPKWKNIAYSEILHPTTLKLTYNYKIPEDKQTKKQLLVNLPNQAIDYDIFRTLEINFADDMGFCPELYFFTKNRVPQFGRLEKFTINMEYTSVNDQTLDVISDLIGKAKALKEFTLKWTDRCRPEYYEKFRKDETENNREFWRNLGESKANTIHLEILGNYYIDGRATDALSGRARRLHFYTFLFKPENAFLKNVRKLTLKVPPSKNTYSFLKNTLENSLRTLEELNVDYYYLVHWHEEKDNMIILLMKCVKLRKLVVNFPMINERWNNIGARLESEVWEAIIQFMDIRPHIYLELVTNINYLGLYDFATLMRFGRTGFINSLEIRENFVPANIDLTKQIMDSFPKIQKLKIVSESDEGAPDSWVLIEYFFKRARHYRHLTEFEINYKRIDAGIYLDYLVTLFEHNKSIKKITEMITSAVYVANYNYKLWTSGDVSTLCKNYVEKYILDESGRRKHEGFWDNLYNIEESKMCTRFRENDSHRLTMTRK